MPFVCTLPEFTPVFRGYDITFFVGHADAYDYDAVLGLRLRTRKGGTSSFILGWPIRLAASALELCLADLRQKK